MAEGEVSRRWEAERRDVKRAEARLRHGLQNLEEARLSYLSSLTKEQRQLQQELLKLQKSEDLFAAPLIQCNDKDRSVRI